MGQVCLFYHEVGSVENEPDECYISSLITRHAKMKDKN